MEQCTYNPVPPRAWSRVQNPCSLGFASPQIPQIFAKGNILQHRANQLPLSASQKYARVVHQQTSSRTKSYATQTMTYTNPNTRRLQRVGTTTYPFPNSIVGAPNNPAGPFVAPVRNPDGCNSTAIESFGNLVCGTRIDACGDLVAAATSNPIRCAESSASDVPGNARLCWDLRLNTWTPRNRQVMSTGANKFPTNYKGLRSAVHFTDGEMG